MKPFLLAALLSLAVSARAQMGGPCMMTELQKLCGAPGTPEFSACAKEKTAQAMAACQGGGAAGAGEKAAKAAKDNPCKDDMKKYCPGMWPGTPEFHSCMSSHMSDVTPACAAFGKKQMAKHGGADGKKMTAGDKACIADSKKHCPGLTGADGTKFIACMTQHYDALSAPCQKMFKGAKDDQGGGANVTDCAKAMAESCPGVQPGGPGMLGCVTEHPEVGAACAGKKGKKK